MGNCILSLVTAADNASLVSIPHADEAKRAVFYLNGDGSRQGRIHS